MALQIENPDFSAKLSASKYSEFLKEITRKDPIFIMSFQEIKSEFLEEVEGVHEELIDDIIQSGGQTFD